MEISLSRHAGFCEGVGRAYEMIEKISKDPDIKKPVFVIGSLVHNDDVVRKISKMGIKKIKIGKSLEKSIGSLRGKAGTLVVTAHGMGPEIYELCKKNKIDLVDTTCPKVIKVQRLAKAYSQKAKVVIVGDKDHKEVRGIFEWSGKKAFIVENEKDLADFRAEKNETVYVLSQTTQNADKVKEIYKILKKKYSKTKLADTICMSTNLRQEEVRKMAKKNDAMIIIGSPESANSNRLFEISKKFNKKSYFIEKAKDIKKSWLKDCKKIGVSAGASTPEWVIEGVIKFLKL